MIENSGRKHVVIVGGGIAGSVLATALGRRWGARDQRSPKVSLIDRDTAHVWKPMLHTIAAGTSDLSQQDTPFLAQAHRAGFSYQPGEMSGLDRRAHEVHIAAVRAPDGRELVPPRCLHYDTLVLAVGSEANDFQTPGVAEHCLKIDSRAQAEGFNREVRIQMLRALAEKQSLTIAIVGGGATGVELAAQLVQLTEAAQAYGIEGLQTRLSIVLIESEQRLLAGFPEDISAATQRKLEALGIRVMTGTRVTAASADGFTLSDASQLPASLKVWAAGVKAPAFLAHLDGLQITHNNQLVVRASLQTTQDASIYAIGDCASLTLPRSERSLAPTAQVANQQAQHLIRHLPQAVERGVSVPDFVYHDLGALVSLGRYDAFGSLGKFGLFTGLTIRGRLAQLSHDMLYRTHQAQLYGFWRGSLLWLTDFLGARVRPSIRMD